MFTLCEKTYSKEKGGKNEEIMKNFWNFKNILTYSKKGGKRNDKNKRWCYINSTNNYNNSITNTCSG